MPTPSPQLIVRLFWKGESSKPGKICRLRRVCGRVIASVEVVYALSLGLIYPWGRYAIRGKFHFLSHG
jgi:hypothetical protein